MVDRIVSAAARDANVPSAEPLPAKALIIEDLNGVLDAKAWENVGAAYIRTQKGQLAVDGQLKLRIANALHTALCHVGALTGIEYIHEAMSFPAISMYLDELYTGDIRPGLMGMAKDYDCINEETLLEWGDAAFVDWIRRLKNPGTMVTWFPCQGCVQKIGLRFLPSIRDHIKMGGSPSKLMAFGIAAIMRFLTPVEAPHDVEMDDPADLPNRPVEEPPQIPDPSDPQGRLVPNPSYEPPEIPDKTAIKPPNWDDKNGDWEAPLIRNPAFLERYILDKSISEPVDWKEDTWGRWEAPLIDNPRHPKNWKPKQIPNPGFGSFDGEIKCVTPNQIPRQKPLQGNDAVEVWCDGHVLGYTWMSDRKDVLLKLFKLRAAAANYGHEKTFMHLLQQECAEFIDKVPGAGKATDYNTPSANLSAMVADLYQKMLVGEAPIDILRSLVHLEMAHSDRHIAKRRAAVKQGIELNAKKAAEHKKEEATMKHKKGPMVPLRVEHAAPLVPPIPVVVGMTVMLTVPNSGSGSDAQALQSNVKDGDVLSVGSVATKQGWKVRAFGTDGKPAVDGTSLKSGDKFTLESLLTGLMLHDNMPSGSNKMILGGLRDDHCFRVVVPPPTKPEAGAEKPVFINNGMRVMLEGVASGLCLHSNAAVGGGFSLGDLDQTKFGWRIATDDGSEKVQVNETLHLLGSDGMFFLSNGSQGSMFCGAKEKDAAAGWKIRASAKDLLDGDANVQLGDTVHLVSVTTGMCLYSTVEHGGGYDWGYEWGAEDDKKAWRILPAPYESLLNPKPKVDPAKQDEVIQLNTKLCAKQEQLLSLSKDAKKEAKAAIQAECEKIEAQISVIVGKRVIDDTAAKTGKELKAAKAAAAAATDPKTKAAVAAKVAADKARLVALPVMTDSTVLLCRVTDNLFMSSETVANGGKWSINATCSPEKGWVLRQVPGTVAPDKAPDDNERAQKQKELDRQTAALRMQAAQKKLQAAEAKRKEKKEKAATEAKEKAATEAKEKAPAKKKEEDKK